MNTKIRNIPDTGSGKVSPADEMRRRVDFASIVYDVIVSTDSMDGYAALEEFEKTRLLLEGRLDENEKAELEKIRALESEIRLCERELRGLETQREALLRDWTENPGEDGELEETIYSPEYEKLEALIEKKEAVTERKRKKYDKTKRASSWNVRATESLMKCSAKLREKCERVAEYRKVWAKALPAKLDRLLSKNEYSVLENAYSVTFILKTSNGIAHGHLGMHYTWTPFSWAVRKKNPGEWFSLREAVVHESRHNAYEAAFEEPRISEEIAVLFARMDRYERLRKMGRIPDAVKNGARASLRKSFSWKGKEFAMRFLSHNRNEILANFDNLLRYRGSTDVCDIDEMYETLKMAYENLDGGSPVKKMMKELIEQYETTVSGFYEELSDLLFVANLLKLPKTARLLLYVTEPREMGLAKEYLATKVGNSRYQALVTLRKIVLPEGISHSVNKSGWGKEIDGETVQNLHWYFTHFGKIDKKRRFAPSQSLRDLPERLRERYRKSHDNPLICAIENGYTVNERTMAFDLAEKIETYVLGEEIETA